MAHNNGNFTFDVYPDHIEVVDYENSGPGKVVIPPTYHDKPVTEIGSNSFQDCTVLTRVTVPATVDDIQGSAFLNCTNLSKVIFLGEAPSLAGDALEGTAENITLYYIQGQAGFTSPTWQGYPAIAITTPLISRQPASVTIDSGKTTTLSVSSSGLFRSFQWYLGVSGDTSSPVSGAKSGSFTTPSLNATTNYWVRISNMAGSVDSATATVTVVKRPEIDVMHPLGTSLVDGTAKKSFGTVKVGQTGKTITITIKNTGSARLKNLAITRAGLHAGDFLITTPSKLVLLPGGSTTFKVTFKPTATGTRRAAIRIRSNDLDERPFDIKLAGFGAS